MSHMKDSISERGRSLEDEYFRRRDREMLEQARNQLEQAQDHQVAADGRRQRAAALGIDDEAIATALSAYGFDAATMSLVYIVPAIQVAWADGRLSAGERAEIERLLTLREMQSSGGLGRRLVAGWLAEEPRGDFYRVAMAALRLLLARLGDDARRRVVTQIVDDCTAVAKASGGLLGLGALSRAESDSIRDLAMALGMES